MGYCTALSGNAPLVKMISLPWACSSAAFRNSSPRTAYCEKNHSHIVCSLAAIEHLHCDTLDTTYDNTAECAWYCQQSDVSLTCVFLRFAFSKSGCSTLPSLLFGLAEDMNLLAPEIASTFCCWPHAAAADRAANSCCTMAELRLDMAVGASTVVLLQPRISVGVYAAPGAQQTARTNSRMLMGC